jgi:uncharacterized RDD family membrane protein YckC
MTSDTQDDRFAPPRAHVEDVESAAGGIQLATRGTRLGAAVIDVVVAMAAMWLLSLVTPWNPFDNQGFTWWQPQFVNPALGFVIFMAVNGWLLATRGQTVGKLLLKIRIARPDGTPASPGRVLGLRYGVSSLINIFPIAGQVWGFIDALSIFRRSRRCLHDSIADTIVLKA